MRILAVHSYYQRPGGEDLSYEAECELLARRGHEVIRYTLNNQTINTMSAVNRAARMLWNHHVQRELRDIIRARRPDVMHCTNLFPLMSPSCYWVAASHGLPIVQALRNYRPLCPAATLFRDKHVCQECLGLSFPWPAIRHHCYRDSHLASASVAVISLLDHAVGSERRVHVYYTPSQFARQRFLDGGFDPERVFVKPNFLEPDPGPGDRCDGGAIFVGRLSPEKGIDTLLDAWRQVPGSTPLRIVGDGPLAPQVKAASTADPRIQWFGYRPNHEAIDLIGRAGCLVMPSTWFETFGRTMMESFARGTPVVASDVGAMVEMVEHERTGLRYPPGDAAGLARAVQRILGEPRLASDMACRARETYLQTFTGDANYAVLMNLYERARVIAAATQRPATSEPVAAADSIDRQPPAPSSPAPESDERQHPSR